MKAQRNKSVLYHKSLINDSILFIFFFVFNLLIIPGFSQESISGTIGIAYSKPNHLLSKKILLQVQKEVYFSTLEQYGKVLSKAVYEELKFHENPNLNFVLSQQPLKFDTLPFTFKKADFANMGGYVSFYGDNPKPVFKTLGFPGLSSLIYLKKHKTKAAIFAPETNFTIVIWTLGSISYQSGSKFGLGWQDETRSSLIYGIYNSITGELIFIDSIGRTNSYAGSDITVSYYEMLEQLAKKLAGIILEKHIKNIQ